MANGRQGGYTYLLMLFVVAVAGYGLALLGESWQVTADRERREELEFTLEAYARAFKSFHGATPDGMSYRPRKLEELVEDYRTGVRRRHIRRLYPNPLTQRLDWLLPSDELGIVGVCLRSQPEQCSTRYEPE